MKINNLNSQIGKFLEKNNKVEPEKVKPAEKEHSASAVSKDSVNLSPQMEKLEEMMANYQGTEKEQVKVQQLKEKIARGEYDLDSKKLAAKMLAQDES
ncbi:flagellar biosynthesis anti-sigma factor FlgM [Candidatus Contubernalis alkaliaceticus]|uniref:flagellar biosynthesis anti-sigma factor FlgM n=1 Tax=Candidatus Contubernalis alkaliaceticus TaxID=338645 RepID=UPI001F4C0DE5|nr:flagellar biosynthesis anti-sigma factor FlgM [Candidatus Contubernalis alkalaceticus]UNC91717.1 flagellar biosynthesis anti-sigma factor FlgM [Candidatus Contubernalis alkalaceticus]